MKNLIIIGGSDAGISSALRAIELDPEFAVTMIVANNYPNFSICGLPYYISNDVSAWKNLAHRTRDEIEKEGVRLLLEHRATSINAHNKTVTTISKSGTLKVLDYDKLIIGTGAVSVKPHIEGIDHPGVFFLRWIPDAFAIDEYIKKHNPQNAIIIGAGYIGMEMSEALSRRGLKVTVVEFFDSVMPSVNVGLGIKIKDLLANNGITVHNNIAVESINKNGGTLIVNGNKGFKIQADMVLVSVGCIPNTELGRPIGINTGVKGAFKVNQKMETNIPDIYAAGDCVETWHKISHKYTYLPLGTVAHKQGRIAGENAIGGNREFAGSLGTQSVKIFDKVIARTGLNEKEAIDAGFTPISIDFETWDHKVYYPTAEIIYMHIIADRMTKRILGAQILGTYKTEVSKRIDLFATALYHDMTVQEFSNYDLSYTPPLSSPWDPVQMAVQKLEKLFYTLGN
jgi:NADPH-dependent 2,4-dienoyl-CoA reductase/sulfur reductase-like enzyme